MTAMEKLVFIHIEKTAGSAQRQLVYDNCGKDNVHWFSDNSISNRLKAVGTLDQRILGGHYGWSFYKQPAYGYITVVREPVGRVLSLYQYLRTKEYASWKHWGLHSSSLRLTLEKSARFRRMINNGQCRYLSGARDYEQTMEHISKHRYLISSLESVDRMNAVLAERLDWTAETLGRINTGEPGYREQLDVDDNVLSLIRELVDQDEQLYRFVRDQKDGIYSTINENDWSHFSGLCYSDIPKPPLAVQTQSIDYSAGQIAARFLICNRSENTVFEEGVFKVVMRLRGRDGKFLKSTGTDIEGFIPPGGRRKYSLKLANLEGLHIEEVQLGISDAGTRRWLGPREIEAFRMTLS